MLKVWSKSMGGEGEGQGQRNFWGWGEGGKGFKRSLGHAAGACEARNARRNSHAEVCDIVNQRQFCELCSKVCRI